VRILNPLAANVLATHARVASGELEQPKPPRVKPLAAVRCGALPVVPWSRQDTASRLREARKTGLTVQRFDGARVYTPKDARNPYTFFVLTGPESQNASRIR
jgi:hypothetical protein